MLALFILLQTTRASPPSSSSVVEEGYGEAGDAFDWSETVCRQNHDRDWCVQKLKKGQKFQKDPNCCAKPKRGGCRKGVHVAVTGGCHDVNEEYVTTCCEKRRSIGTAVVVLLATMLPVLFICFLVGAVTVVFRRRKRRRERQQQQQQQYPPPVVLAAIDHRRGPDHIELVHHPSKPLTATPVNSTAVALDDDDGTIPFADVRPLDPSSSTTLPRDDSPSLETQRRSWLRNFGQLHPL